MAGLFEYLWGHVAWRPTGRRKNMKSFLVHDPA